MRNVIGRWWWLLNYCFWSRVYDADNKKKRAREYGETLATWAESMGRDVPVGKATLQQSRKLGIRSN